MRLLLIALTLFATSLMDSGATRASSQEYSRVYVTVYDCSNNQGGSSTASVSLPTVELYDQSAIGKRGASPILHPQLHKGIGVEGGVGFYFDVTPGYYELSLLCASREVRAANGPLIVIPGANRNIVVFAANGVTDWHARLALAGVLPIESGISVRAVLLDRPAKCGDEFMYYAAKESDGIVDGGVYYANLMAYDQQDLTIALVLSGALFTQREILLTKPLGGPGHAHDLVIRSLDYDAVWAALQATPPGRFVCVDRF